MSIQAVSWVLDHSQSRGLARLVLISLANATNKDANGECWPSMRTISQEAGVSLGAIPSKIGELVELGEVEVVDRGNQRKSARYRLVHLSVQEMNSERSGDELTVQSRGEQNRKEPTTSPNGDTNGLFEAFYEFWFRKPYKPGARLTGSLRGRLNKAVKEAEQAGLAADEVVVRGKRYREEWPDMERTPQALLLHWERFAPEAEPVECDECDSRGVIWFSETGEQVGWDDYDAATAYKCQACSAVPGGEE